MTYMCRLGTTILQSISRLNNFSSNLYHANAKKSFLTGLVRHNVICDCMHRIIINCYFAVTYQRSGEGISAQGVMGFEFVIRGR